MRSTLRAILIVAINVTVFAALLGAIELYYRIQYAGTINEFPDHNGLWQKFQSYVMFTTAPGQYKLWFNSFTNELVSADITTNSLGFNDRHEFDYSKPYKKDAKERVVLFTGGSAAWGVGSTSNGATIPGRMQHYLNELQHDYKYTVINLAMGSWIAFQEFMALELWGDVFRPDWIVVMDGFNDASVGCTYSQGTGNPMYSATARSYIDGYLFSTHRPVFYRGWLENELIRVSAAYRTLTGKQYVPNTQIFDEASSEASPVRRQVVPTKVAQSREMLAFYLKSTKALLKLYPDAGYIISTQPTVNSFTGDFVDTYQWPAGSVERGAAMAKREKDLEHYLTVNENHTCGVKTMPPSYTYVLGNSAIQLERLAQDMQARGRRVEYHNMGTLFPEARTDRMPYFIDAAHLSDAGNDVLGRFYAERIVAAGAVER